MRRVYRILLSETGQMSVFVALIFQVLFVFFAMVINIGLVVHDKINLQNSVDLGAYYAAQKQAEILNEIAHINYQIRQDYKLLVWRYYVMGTLGGRGGGGRNSPALSNLNTPQPDTLWNPGEQFVSVCAANNYWIEFGRNSQLAENYCFQSYGVGAPLSPILTIIPGASFIPGIGAARASSILARQNQIASCEGAAGVNWLLAMQMIYAYKLSVAGKKAMIYELRKRLVSADMIDQNMQSVRTGVLNTIRNNLTQSNRDSFSEEQFQVLNGLNHESCLGPDGDGAGTLPEIFTQVLLPFTNATPGQCRPFQSYVSAYASMPASNSMAALDPDGLLQALTTEPSTSTDQGKLLHSSLGFEKNPWCMAYMGVRARTTPRKPFAPFGSAVSMEARAFAQPFGGRVGPWFAKIWPRGVDRSDGDDRTDPLTTARVVNGAPIGATGNYAFIPNYSRYPGDQIGMRSTASIAATRGLIKQTAGATLSYSFYSVFDDIQTSGDPLVWVPPDRPTGPVTNGIPNSVSKLRLAETIAVAPDVFDATYYSIDPQYYTNYLSVTAASPRFPTMPSVLGKQYSPMPDIGARNNVPEIRAETIATQIVKANAQTDGLDPMLLNNGALKYPLSNWQHLLTGWSTNSPTTFNFPDGKFGVCDQAAATTVMVPGGCAYGGRVGYSVRVIARDHLVSEGWAIGGNGGGTGPILNPPPNDF